MKTKTQKHMPNVMLTKGGIRYEEEIGSVWYLPLPTFKASGDMLDALMALENCKPGQEAKVADMARAAIRKTKGGS